MRRTEPVSRLRPSHPRAQPGRASADPTLDFDLDTPLPEPSGACGEPETAPASPDDLGPGDIPHTDAFKAVAARRLPVATERPWL